MNDSNGAIKETLFSRSRFGVRVARMHPDYVTREVSDTITKPHRHDYYSLLLLETGCLRLQVDFQPVEVSPHSILILRPGQVHQTADGSEISGWIMLFDGKIIDRNARFAIEQSMQSTIQLAVPSTQRQAFVHLLAAIHDAVKSEQVGKFHHQFVQALLNAFFYRTVDILDAQEAAGLESIATRSIVITRSFNQLLKENYRRLKKPAEYAAQLNITSSYLNDTLKSVTGSSCSQLIQQEIIAEAQRLLYYTSISVKEIAGSLGYNDYKYFIRLFGRVVGMTPSIFRSQSLNLNGAS